MMSEGTLKLAKLGGAPLVLVAGASKGFVRLKSWDKMLVPLPFSTGLIIYRVIRPDDALFQDANGVKSLLDEMTNDVQKRCGA